MADVKKYLEQNKIKYEEHKHKAVFTVEESKQLKNSVPGLHCKTLFLKDSNGKFYLVGMPAEKRLDSKNLKDMLNVKKIRFATPAELKQETDLVPGSVSIFGILNSDNKRVILIIDKAVWEADSVGFHPNINTSTIILNKENMKKFFDLLDCEKKILEL